MMSYSNPAPLDKTKLIEDLLSKIKPYSFERCKTLIPENEFDLSKITEYVEELIKETASKLSEKYMCDIPPEQLEVIATELFNHEGNYEVSISVDIPVYLKPRHAIKIRNDKKALSSYLENDDDKIHILSCVGCSDCRHKVDLLYSTVFTKLEGFPKTRGTIILRKYSSMRSNVHASASAGNLSICGTDTTNYYSEIGLVTQVNCKNCSRLLDTFGYKAFAEMEASA